MTSHGPNGGESKGTSILVIQLGVGVGDYIYKYVGTNDTIIH